MNKAVMHICVHMDMSFVDCVFVDVYILRICIFISLV